MTRSTPVPHCQSCASRAYGVFCELDRVLVDYMDGHKTSNHYRSGQVLFYEGNRPFGLFCINSGKIKLYKSGFEGRQTIVRLAFPGDLLGYRSLFSSQAYTATAEVIEEADVCFLPREVVEEIIGRDPSVALRLMEYLSRTLGEAENRLRDFVQKSVRERVAEILSTLGCVNGKAAGFRLPLSREEMAELIGSTPESVIRTLSDFRREGIIALRGRDCTVLDGEALAEAANITD